MKATAQRMLRRALPVVQRELGPVDPVKLVVGSPREILRWTVEAEQALLGTQRSPQEPYTDLAYGYATLAPRGLLAAVCEERNEDPMELATTVVHELVHCWQMSGSRYRERKLRWIRNNYGLLEMSSWECRAADRKIRQHEQQAVSLERLALKIRGI